SRSRTTRRGLSGRSPAKLRSRLGERGELAAELLDLIAELRRVLESELLGGGEHLLLERDHELLELGLVHSLDLLAAPRALRTCGASSDRNSAMSETPFWIDAGVIPCSSLYASCFSRRRVVSSIAYLIASVYLSAYISTLPLTFLAARPIVWISAVWPRRKPSLSASRIATSETSGRSSPSRRRLTPTSTSYSPS